MQMRVVTSSARPGCDWRLPEAFPAPGEFAFHPRGGVGANMQMSFIFNRIFLCKSMEEGGRRGRYVTKSWNSGNFHTTCPSSPTPPTHHHPFICK